MSAILTFDEIQQALESSELKKAVRLMKQIDQHLAIESDVRVGVRGSPQGEQIVLIHQIHTPVDAAKLRYIAAVKGKALLDQEPGRKNPS